MCNACGFYCCASDQFEGCGCDTCGYEECLQLCEECGEAIGLTAIDGICDECSDRDED